MLHVPNIGVNGRFRHFPLFVILSRKPLPVSKKFCPQSCRELKKLQEMLLWRPRNGKITEVIAILCRFFGKKSAREAIPK